MQAPFLYQNEIKMVGKIQTELRCKQLTDYFAKDVNRGESHGRVLSHSH